MIDYDKLGKSLQHLTLQYQNYCLVEERCELSGLDKEAIAESVIHRFETCYDSLWKTLKRYLCEELGLADLPNSPKPILQIAFENGLITDIIRWKNYANARTATSHDYSFEKAADTLQLMKYFIDDTLSLYHKMHGAPLQ